ncbi:GtrA family protein [Arvimicrobium flavum]|uniref:GtrA family protein n=1 Tax=Arvimicrobium flavum TaxID=3393320 RepID=UPI00237C1B07|nr:GtrA family protein [Mesorhizobium shangrilense]
MLALRSGVERRWPLSLLDSQFVRYFICGGVASLVHLLILALLVEIAGVQAGLASTTAFSVAVVVNYFLQSRYTFQSDEPHLIALPKFFGMAVLGGVVNLMIFLLLDQVMYYMLAQCIAILSVFLFNYTVSSRFIFIRKAD